ncbi:MAG: class I SAM-dependent methyltransferase [bacterium]|nr:class I SAM-dependent methyltransferase [bacterium]
MHTGAERMNSQTELRMRWNDLHAKQRYCPRYPDEAVVRWALTSFPGREDGTARALDLGCGAGRHAIFLAQEGFETSVVDLSQKGLDATTQRAASEGLQIDAQLAAVDTFDFPPGFFDAVLSYSVYCYAPLERIGASIARVADSLKPGGRFLCFTRTTADWRRGFGTPTGPERCRINALDGTPADAEAGLELTFLEEPTLRRLFEPFHRIEVNRRSVSRQDGHFIDDDWLVTAVR